MSRTFTVRAWYEWEGTVELPVPTVEDANELSIAEIAMRIEGVVPELTDYEVESS